MKTPASHWNHVRSDDRIIAFCRVMDHWEFYWLDGQGYLTHITHRRLRGFGRARAFAKQLLKTN